MAKVRQFKAEFSFLFPVTHISLHGVAIKSVSLVRDLGAILETHLSLFPTSNLLAGSAHLTFKT